MALLGSEEFGVQEVEIASLRFGPNGAPTLHERDAGYRDTNGDGFDDGVSLYRTEEAGIGMTDTETCLSGVTLDGPEFEGCDTIRIVPACGLGFELALVAFPIARMRSRWWSRLRS